MLGECNMSESCPKCHKEMIYYSEMNNWYCHACRIYRYPMKNMPGVDAVSKRSILNIMKLIVGAICGVSGILVAIGVFQLYLSFESYNSTQNLVRGALNLSIAMALLLIVYLYIYTTLGKKNWWNRMQLYIDFQSKLSEGSTLMKRSLVEIFQIYYGSIIIIGIILLLLGITFINTLYEPEVLILSGFQTIIGILLIFLSYLKYRKDMEMLSRDIYPILFPDGSNSDMPTPPPPPIN